MNLLLVFLVQGLRCMQDHMVRGKIEFPSNFNSHIDYL